MIKKFLKIGITFLALIALGIVLFSFFLAQVKRAAIRPREAFPLPSPRIGSDLPFPEKAQQVYVEPKISSRMIVKTGHLNLVVKDVSETAREIGKFAEEKGGFVVSMNIFEKEKIPSGSISVRVPSENFEEAMNFFKSLATRVQSEKIDAQDITEEYIDLESRLKNLEAAEAQLLEIMKRSGTIKDVLEVQRELTSVREQIERTKGKMKYLKESVKMSLITVNLALSEEVLPIPPAEKWRPKYVLLLSWKSVLEFWKGFSYLLIAIVVWAQVWVPLLGIIFIVRRILKKRKSKIEIS